MGLAGADVLNPGPGGGGGGAPSGPAGGSLTGNYPDPGIGNEKIGEGQLTAALLTKINEKGAGGISKGEAEALLLTKGLNAASENTRVGLSAGSKLEGASSQNTAVGYEALASAKGLSNYNTAIGYRAMASFTGHKGGESAGAEGYNVAIGTNAGHNLTVGSGHVIIGTTAGGGLTTGEECVVIGCEAYGGNATGGVAVGFRALNSNTTGTPVLAVGYQAAAANTTGTYILAIGTDALTSTSTGSHQLAIGHNTLEKSTGHSNQAGGDSALRSLTTGNENVVWGYTSFSQLTTGEENTAIGYGAGYYATGNSSKNVCLGYGAGPGANAEVSNRLYIHNGASNTPLIGGNFEAKTVQVHGTLEPEHLTYPKESVPIEALESEVREKLLSVGTLEKVGTIENGVAHAALSETKSANVTLYVTLNKEANKAANITITTGGVAFPTATFASNSSVQQIVPIDFNVGPGKTFAVSWNGAIEKVEGLYQFLSA